MDEKTEAEKASEVKDLKKEDEGAQPPVPDQLEDFFVKNAAKHIENYSPDVAEAIASGLSKASLPELISGSGLNATAKGILAMVTGAGEGFMQAREKQAEKKKIAAEAKAKVEEAIQKKVTPILQDFSKNNDVVDETTRADAIDQVRTLLPQALTNDKIKSAIEMTLAQAIRPEYKRLPNEPAPSLATLAGASGLVFGEGVSEAVKQLQAKLKSGNVMTKDDVAEVESLLSTLESGSKAKYARAATPYTELFYDAGIGGLAQKYLKPPKGYSLYESVNVEQPEAVPELPETTSENMAGSKTDLPEGSTGTGADGKKYKVVGGVWVSQ